jgi:hypothetical protein
MQGSLTEGKHSVRLTSLYYFRSAPNYIENTIYLFNKTSYLNEEVNLTEPFPLVMLCLHRQCGFGDFAERYNFKIENLNSNHLC